MSERLLHRLQQLLQHNKGIDMKHVFYTFLAAVSISTLSHAKSIVIESPTLEIILEHIPQKYHENNKKILVLLDVDDTLITRDGGLGSSHWYDCEKSRFIERGYTEKEADNITLTLFGYTKIHSYTKFRLTHTFVPTLIETLKQRGIACLGLTANPFLLGNTNNKIFEILGFTFNGHHFPSELYFLVGERIVGFQHGIIMSNQNSKGESLEKFLEITQYHPDEIIFADDKLSKVIEVKALAEKMGIDFVGIRFSGMDTDIQKIDLDKAAQQLDELCRTGVIA